jgi:glutamate formiminotransferase / 5-formyltetrahydrofolate cyclo-ligase
VRDSEIVLEAVPNVSEGRDPARIEAFGRILGGHGCTLLDVHSDEDHNRTVYTLVGGPQEIADSLVSGARAVIEQVDMRTHDGAHPCVGALDVVPIVYLRSADRALAHDEALAVGNRLAGELDLPVFAYGELATSEERRERAFFREGGIDAASERLANGELAPDFGPARLHPTAGAALVTARPPLVAFNVQLDTADVDVAKAIAAQVREAGGGLAGVRAIGVLLASRGVAQVSTNVHDPLGVPLREVVEAVRAEATERGTRVTGAEVVGLTPEAALDGFPDDVPLNGFDPARHVLERRVGLKVSDGVGR